MTTTETKGSSATREAEIDEVARRLSCDERNLLLYLETCAVDKRGCVNSQHMNGSDIDCARNWNDTGFLRFGRLKAIECTAVRHYWVRFLDQSYAVAAVLRRMRADRNWVTSRDQFEGLPE